MSRPQNSCRNLLQPLNQPIRAPKRQKVTPKLSQNQMLELKKTYNIKVVQLHEQIQKQFFNPTPTSDDNSGLFNKKSVLQTKYRPLFIKKTDQIQNIVSEHTDQNLKCHSEESKAENRGTLSYTIAQIAYLTSSQWKLTQCT